MIDGIVPIIPVPFADDDSIDEDGLRKLIDFCVDGGASAVCLPAYASEFYKLTEIERVRVVAVAADQAADRIPVIGQANHVSVTSAIALAQRMEEVGADLISMAAPRTFALSEEDLLRYFRQVCAGIVTELLIQDFNPGGPTVGPSFARRLADDCPNFRYLKLEDPMMGPRIRAIREATDDRIGVLEGWGGMYMLELIPAGICGVMPGTPLLRILDRVYRDRKAGRDEDAYRAFQSVLPFIVFSLQHMELFLHVEKRLLQRMGVIASARVREATITLDPDTEAFADFLIDQLLPLV
jgi:2-keto-3-deoxy-L-arabinonate dehydratase